MKHPFEALREEYARLWHAMSVAPALAATVDKAARKLLGNINRYRAVEARTGVPAVLIAAIHERECSANFRGHLHNGDPLGKRTVHVPAGRPLSDPPWTWETSAEDALALDGLSAVKNWTIEQALFRLELYNGFGPRDRGIHTGYLWAGTNHYARGKYVADGKWDLSHVDRQLGCAPLMARMIVLEPALALPETPVSAAPGALATLKITPLGVGGGLKHGAAWLQDALNRLGAEPRLAVDGSYGRHTGRAVVSFQRAHGLDADGLAGPKTFSAVESALADRDVLAPLAAEPSRLPQEQPRKDIAMSPPANASTVTVPVKPATESKINWTNAVSGVAVALTALTGGKFGLTTEQQALVVSVLGVVTPAVTVALRTWFTRSVTPASVK